VSSGRRAAAATAETRLGLLSAFELVCNTVPVVLPMSAQRVVAFLALHSCPLLRAYVAGTLWPETSEQRAHASLRSALWRLHRVDHRLVEATSKQLRLAPDVRVDVRETESFARLVISGSTSLEENERVQELLLHDLLPGWYDDWLAVERECFRELRLHALETLCKQLTEAERLGQALVAGLAAVSGDPLRESAHRALINVYLAEGNHGEAVRQYQLYRSLLRERLGLEPSTQIQQLVNGLLRQAEHGALPH
jgi:DNA-binding SARP family transcriptional activator